jgi:phosphate transport system permease protein
MIEHVKFDRKIGLWVNRFFRWDFFRVITAFMALISLGCIVGLFIFLIVQSAPILMEQKWNFLLGQDWWAGEVYGALPMIYGSCMVTGLALVLALPLAVGGAVFTSEFLSAKRRLGVKALMELFAGIPGIIYGLLGVALLTGWVKDSFGLIDGNTLLTAGLLLAIMILPTILTLSEDALNAVPGQYRDASLSLGLTKLQMIISTVIPEALPGIAGAVFLGLGRALGETIAVMLVIGGLDKIADPWYDLFVPAQSIASKLGREAAEAIGTDLQWSALMALGLALFLIVMFFTLMGNLFLKRVR